MNDFPKIVIEKRDGQIVPFDGMKIYLAMMKAGESVDKVKYGPDTEYQDFCIETAKRLIQQAIEFHPKHYDVEFVQDMVITTLMDDGRFGKIGVAYAKYRKKREKARQEKNPVWATFKMKLMADNVVNQNANVDERSFGGRMGEARSAVLKDYALNYCMSDMAKNNHLNNEIYIHDLDSYAVGMHNCLDLPMDDLLANGFKVRQTDIRPAQSINTAFQLVAVLFQVQSLQQFGGVAATHIDWTMVPYVRKSFFKHWKDGLKYVEQSGTKVEFDKNRSIEDFSYKKFPKAYTYAKDMTERELKQAAEGLYHNLNSLQSRSGNQLN